MQKKQHGFSIVAMFLVVLVICVVGFTAWRVLSSRPASKPTQLVQHESRPRYKLVNITKLIHTPPNSTPPYLDLFVYSDGSGVITGAQVFSANTFDAKQLEAALKTTDLSTFHDTCTHPSTYDGVEVMTYYKTGLPTVTPQGVTISPDTQVFVKGIDCYIATNPNTELSKQLTAVLQISLLGTD